MHYPSGNSSVIITSAFTSQPMATAVSTFSSAHRLYVKSLYKRYLTNALDWTINRDIWRWQAMQIRAEFERNRSVVRLLTGQSFLLILYSNVHDPRALAAILQKAETDLANMKHPDPYIRESRWLNSIVGCLFK